MTTQLQLTNIIMILAWPFRAIQFTATSSLYFALYNSQPHYYVSVWGQERFVEDGWLEHFVLREKKENEKGDDYITTNFIICILHLTLLV